MQEQNALEEIETKSFKKAERMLKSDSARQRRKQLKEVREIKLLNEWAKQRRARKAAKKH
jgi:hypothetical protein